MQREKIHKTSGKWVKVVVVLAATVLGCLSVSSSAHSVQPVKLEAESMDSVSGKSNKFKDRAASENIGRALWSNGSAVKRIETQELSGMKIRVRADRCKGSPAMNVFLNGRKVASKRIENTRWREVEISRNFPAGTKTLRIAFPNDLKRRGCDRNLRLDKITFIPKATSVPIPGPAEPSEPSSPVDETTPVEETGSYSEKGNCPTTLQSLINSAQPGSTLNVPGDCVYRETVRISKPLTLDAEAGAEIRGSDVWSAFDAVDGKYVSRNTVPIFSVKGAVGCEPDTKRCQWPEQVFENGNPLEQVKSNPSSGEFAVNEDRQVILADNPSDKMIEVTTRKHWVTGGADNVTVQGFSMKHAGNDAQVGAFYNSGYSNWTIRDNVFSRAHSINVKLDFGSNLKLVDNEIKQAGQLGVGGFKSASEITGNRIHSNNLELFDTSWEAGGIKMVTVSSLKVDSNVVHSNFGNGIWCDIDCKQVEISNNRAYNNSGSAIFYEISDDAEIFGNVLWENSWKNPRQNTGGSWTSAAIRSANSRDVKIYDNTLAWNRGNIAVVSVEREQPRWNTVRNVQVYGNKIFSEDRPSNENLHSGHRVHAFAWLESWEGGTLFKSSANNRGSQNSYWYENPENSTPRFYWGNHSGTWGKDRGGLSKLSDFNNTIGESGGSYISTSEKNRIANENRIPSLPEPR